MIFTVVLSVLLNSPARLGTTPEATLRSVVAGFNQQNVDSILRAYETVAPGAKEALNKVFTQGTQKDGPVFVVDSVTVSESGDTATAKIGLRTTGQNPYVPPAEIVKLVRVSGDWKISNQADPKVARQNLFAGLGLLLKDPKWLDLQAKEAEGKSKVISNMKQVSLAIILFSSDNDGVYSLTTATLQTKLTPYLRNIDVFKGPDGKPLLLVFNSNLTGKKDSEIRRPGETVILTLGGRDNLIFTEDLTPIAFVDGHVKYVSRADTAKLNWNP